MKKCLTALGTVRRLPQVQQTTPATWSEPSLCRVGRQHQRGWLHWWLDRSTGLGYWWHSGSPPHWVWHLLCPLSHSLHLVIHDGFKSAAQLNKVSAKDGKLVSHVRHSIHASDLLEGEKRLQPSNQTRWNSQLTMIRYILSIPESKLHALQAPPTAKQQWYEHTSWFSGNSNPIWRGYNAYSGREMCFCQPRDPLYQRSEIPPWDHVLCLQLQVCDCAEEFVWMVHVSIWILANFPDCHNNGPAPSCRGVPIMRQKMCSLLSSVRWVPPWVPNLFLQSQRPSFPPHHPSEPGSSALWMKPPKLTPSPPKMNCMKISHYHASHRTAIYWCSGKAMEPPYQP